MAQQDAVIRLLREAGHWKLHTQRWLVNTPPGPEQKAALVWLEARPARRNGCCRSVRTATSPSRAWPSTRRTAA